MLKIVKVVLWIMVVIMFLKVLGFFREFVFVNFYGIGMYVDVFVLILNIFGLIIVVIGFVVVIIYIFMYFEIKKRFGDEGVLKFINNVLNICYIMVIVIVIIGFLFIE